MGVWITFTTTVIALGPLLGGWIIDNVSWRYIFFINVPLGLTALTVAYFFIPESKNEGSADKPLDWQGAVALIIGLGGMIFGLIEGSKLGWTSPIILGAFGLMSLGIGGFVYIESKSANPLIPLSFFLIIEFSGINILTILYFMAFNGVIFFVTLNFIQVQGYTAFAVGLALLPITLSIFILSTPVGRLTDRYGPQKLMVVGILISLFGFLQMARLGLETIYWLSFFPAILTLGIGLGIMIVPMTLVLLRSLPPQFSGVASGSNYAATRLGNMLAIAIFGAVMVGWFQPALIQRVGVLDLPEEVQTGLIAESRNLGALSPPENIASDLNASIVEAIQLSFIDSFQFIMWLCVGLMLLSLLFTFLMIEGKKSKEE